MRTLLHVLWIAVKGDDPEARQRERQRMILRAEQEEAWRYGYYLDDEIG